MLWEQFIASVEPGSKQDRVIGMIYGHALGDAVGLQSEFKVANLETGIKFPYDRPIRDYPKCDWTDDTDHLILVMQSLIANSMIGRVPASLNSGIQQDWVSAEQQTW
jgi:ADP-ribosylglycohydrolase